MKILKYLKHVFLKNLGSIVIGFWVSVSFAMVLAGTLLFMFFGNPTALTLSAVGILLFPPIFLLVAGIFAKIFESYRTWKEGEEINV